MHAMISKLKFTLIKQYMLVKHECEFKNIKCIHKQLANSKANLLSVRTEENHVHVFPFIRLFFGC